MEWTGGCLCGAVRFVAHGAPRFLGHCHCKMCQRASGSLFMTAVEFQNADVEWLQGERSFYESSPGNWRSFCPTCGGSTAQEYEDKTWLYVGSLDEPEKLPMNPPRNLDAAHIFVTRQIPWIHIEDDLPRHAESSP